MVMNAEQTDLESYKRELLVRSEGYRQALRNEIGHAAASVAWVPKTLSTLRFASPILLMLAPAAAFAAVRWATGRGAAPALKARTSLIGKVFAAVRIFQQVKPLWDGYRRAKSP